jgi:arylesterase/paraoxonase
MNVQVFSLNENHLLRKLHTLDTLPIDNLSVDSNGDIYGAALPRVYRWIQSSKNAFGTSPPSTVVKISKIDKRAFQRKARAVDVESWNDDDYVVEKVFEDNSGLLPGSTVVVHDAKEGRFFLGGVISPYITICST